MLVLLHFHYYDSTSSERAEWEAKCGKNNIGPKHFGRCVQGRAFGRSAELLMDNFSIKGAREREGEPKTKIQETRSTTRGR